MKKIISILTAAVLIIAAGTISILHSKADIKVEKTQFSVEVDRTQKPSAYCMNADGSALCRDYSNSGYFCIDRNHDGKFILMNYNGNIAYCIGKHYQKSPASSTQADKYTDIPLDKPEYAAIFSAAAAGASVQNGMYGLSRTDICYVTICAIRSIVYGIPAESLAFYDTDKNYNAAMTDEFRHLRDEATRPLAQPSTSLEFENLGISLEQVFIGDQCYYKYGPYRPYSPECQINEYSLSYQADEKNIFTSSDPDTQNTTQEFSFNSSSTFYVFINACYTDNVNISVSSDISLRTYEPTVYLTNDSGYQDIAQIKMTDSFINARKEINLQNQNTLGEIKILKKFISSDSEITDRKLISQPRFTVKHSTGKYVNGIVGNGKIIFNNFSDEPVEYSLNINESSLCISGLPVGEYIICETHGADGFCAEQNEISIFNSNETNSTDFINRQVTTATTEATTTTETTTQQTTVTTTSCTTTEASTTSESITETTPAVTTTDCTAVETPAPSFSTEIILTEQSFQTNISVSESTANTRQSQYRVRTMLSSSPNTGDNNNRLILFIPLCLAGVIITVTAIRKKS